MNPNQPNTVPVATPQPISASTIPQVPQSPAKLQARITYAGALFSIGKNGLLEWGADEHIRLFAINTRSNQSTGVIFDIGPNDISKVAGNGATLIIQMKDGRKYSFRFSWAAPGGIGIAGGLIGIAIENKMVTASGVPQWIEEFRRNNVTISYLSTWAYYRKLFIFGGIVGVILIVVVVILALLQPS
jgi:hypothetical protein